ncbi:MAG: FapA family protein [Ruminiclostridium sp.]
MAEPINGTVTVNIDEKYMTAHIVVTEPLHGGKPVTEEEARRTVAENGIRYNVIESAFDDIFKGGGYGHSVLLAKGDAPVDGENGYLKYYFEQASAAVIKEDEFGNVDYRDLGTIKNIKQGEVIADIVPETPGKPGKDIRGVVQNQFPGKPAKVYSGNGVAVSEDGTKLIAAVSGNLRWNKDRFVVDDVLTISDDVDLSVGNIDFIGDIVIKGNINEGFVVKAVGDINVFGNITGANVTSESSISVRLGIINSEVKAAGDITASFCENSTIESNGNCTAQSFVSCTLFCNGNLTAKGGKSAIVGGKYTCLSDVEANYIGSDTYIRTIITLGNVAVLAEEKIEHEKKLKEYNQQLEQLNLVCETLQKQKKAGQLPQQREEMLATSIRAKFGHMKAINAIKARIADIEKEINGNNDLKVKVNRAIFPGVTIRINNSRLTVSDKKTTCKIGMNDNREIVITC